MDTSPSETTTNQSGESKPGNTPHSKLIVVLALVLILGGVFWAFSRINNSVYTIMDVPYTGIHNHVEQNSLILNPIDSTLYSLLQYWYPGKFSPLEIQSELGLTRFGGQFPVISTIIDFMDQLQVVDTSVAILDVNDLDTYINAERSTPLITYLPSLDRDKPDTKPNLLPYILVGVDEKNKTLTFYNYWLGPNIVMSFSEFNQLQDVLGSHFPTMKNKYVVVEPADRSNYTKEDYVGDAPLTVPHEGTLTSIREILNDFAVNEWYIQSGNIEDSKRVQEKIVQHSQFDSLPPFLKMHAASNYARTLLEYGMYDEAETYAQIAVDSNVAFDEPSGDWGGYWATDSTSGSRGSISIPFQLLADVYAKQGNNDLARENYKKALAIDENNKDAMTGLERLDVE